jgi:DNA-binding NarL/FixJ family response regulator
MTGMRVTMRIQILLVAEWEIDRNGFRHLLSSTNKTEILAESPNDPGIVETAIRCSPDVVVICIGKNEFVDAELIRSLKCELPMTKIVIVSSAAAVDEILSYLMAGVDAYWLKGIPQDLIVPALQSLCLDHPGFTPALAAFVFRLVESQFPGVASLSSTNWQALKRRKKQNGKQILRPNIQYDKAASFH